MDNVASGNPILANLFRFNQWANVELIDGCAQLGDELLDAEAPGALGTIRQTLWRLVEIEHRYLAALHGDANAWFLTLSGGTDGELATLRVLALDTGEQLVAWAEATSGDPMLTGIWRDNEYTAPASVFAGQVILHGKEHRQQVQEALLQRGITTPDLSVWNWWNTERSVGLESPTI
ncbi:MAG: hypothetical protein KC432_16220 [Thermomicrobiales bacterium]|nr:hypothetical protein [Thermomicrobiales bacterium]